MKIFVKSLWLPLVLCTIVCVGSITIQRHQQPKRHHKHKKYHKLVPHEVPEKELQWVELKEKLTPEERAQRERWAKHGLKALEKVCSTFTKFTPCACHEVLTNAKIHHDNKIMYLEYPEYACDGRENRRKDDGRIAPGYTCAQLKTRRTLYRDEYQQPIELEIVYRAGCELRCINIGCQPVNQAVNHTTNPDVDEEDKEWKKNKGKYVDIEEGVEIMRNEEEKNKNELDEGIKERKMSDAPKSLHLLRHISKEQDTEHIAEEMRGNKHDSSKFKHRVESVNYNSHKKVHGAGESKKKYLKSIGNHKELDDLQSNKVSNKFDGAQVEDMIVSETLRNGDASEEDLKEVTFVTKSNKKLKEIVVGLH